VCIRLKERKLGARRRLSLAKRSRALAGPDLENWVLRMRAAQQNHSFREAKVVLGENANSSSSASALPPEEVIFGRSEAMDIVRRRVDKIASANVPVLLQGDGGTGKEVVARWIHSHSCFKAGQFVKVSCAAIPGTLLESELFGYEKGAFTGAHTARPGRVEQAHEGTLFLDNIADLNLSLQSKLLHFLQDGCFSRIGDSAERTVKTRLMCATHRNLEEEVNTGRFRADLFYRINVIQIRLPRLRDRREDIPLLAEFFREQYMRQFGRLCEPLSPQILGYLQNQLWPGNVRELSNGIARYVVVGPEASLTEEVSGRRMTGFLGAPVQKTVPLKRVARDAVRELEKRVIVEALRANQWNRRKTAVALKISYRTLIYKIRNAGLAQRMPRTSLEEKS
jgi:two-component system, NtrC family, response regulator AtoC